MQTEPSALATLGWLLRAKSIASKSYPGAAEEWLSAVRAPADIAVRLKAAVGASTADLSSFGISLGSFSDSLRTRSVFFRLMSDAAVVRLPLNTKIGVVSSTATGSVVPEGEAIPLSKVTIDGVLLTAVKAAAMIVCTDSLLRDVSAGGQSLLSREIAGAVSDAVDLAFLDLITSTGTASIGSSSPLADVRAALLALDGGSASRPYWVASKTVACLASTLSSTKGPAFAAASMVGGELSNLPMLVSSAVPAGSLFLLDAAQIAADAGPVSVDTSSNADVLMAAPAPMSSDTPTPSQMVSMFGTDSTAIRAVAWLGAETLRDTAVVEITGITTTTWPTT